MGIEGIEHLKPEGPKEFERVGWVWLCGLGHESLMLDTEIEQLQPGIELLCKRKIFGDRSAPCNAALTEKLRPFIREKR